MGDTGVQSTLCVIPVGAAPKTEDLTHKDKNSTKSTAIPDDSSSTPSPGMVKKAFGPPTSLSDFPC